LSSDQGGILKNLHFFYAKASKLGELNPDFRIVVYAYDFDEFGPWK